MKELDHHQAQLRRTLIFLNEWKRACPLIGGLIVAFAILCLVAGFFRLRNAEASGSCPVVAGRIVSSEFSAEQDEGFTYYRPKIEYAYQVNGKAYLGKRVAFDSRSGADGTLLRFSDKGAAEAVLSRFPLHAVVQVHYNPRAPVDAALEPGVSTVNYAPLIGGAVCLLVAALFMRGFPKLIESMMRSAVESLAKYQGPQLWEVAAEFGLKTPPVPPREPQILLPVEAEHRIAWAGRDVLLRFSGCLTNTVGDFTGNLGLAVWSLPPLAEVVLVENLKLKIPGHDALLSVLGYGAAGGRLEVAFSLSDIAPADIGDLQAWERELALRLKNVEVWWGRTGEQKLGTVSCVQAPA